MFNNLKVMIIIVSLLGLMVCGMGSYEHKQLLKTEVEKDIIFEYLSNHMYGDGRWKDKVDEENFKEWIKARVAVEVEKY
jgi:hypothetical protein